MRITGDSRPRGQASVHKGIRQEEEEGVKGLSEGVKVKRVAKLRKPGLS